MKTAAEYIKIEELHPWENNPRKNNHAVDEIVESIKRFGFSSPIIARREDNTIIAGHTRYKAALKLGLKEVPVRYMDLSVVDSQLLAIADNKLNERADWDDELLEQVLSELANEDLSGLGFDDEELDKIIAENSNDLTEDQEPEELPEDYIPVSKIGEIYQLGEHRLMCGDSTIKENWDLLLDGEEIDMIFTDPPYGIAYKRINGDFDEIINDGNQVDASNVVEGALRAMGESKCHYVCCDWRSMQMVSDSMEKVGIKTKACIVWNKMTGVQNLDKYYKQHEMIIYSGEYGGSKTLCGDIWDHKRDFKPNHPTPKPVSLIEQAISTSGIRKGGIIADAFGGSGSTMIAAAKTKRRSRLMELDPKYCDAIRKRWASFAKENNLDIGDGLE